MAIHYSKNEKDEIFNGIVKTYYNAVCFYCYKKLHNNSGEAKDCTQDVFCTLYKMMDELRDFNKIKKWLYRTADNHIKRILKKKAFENEKWIHPLADVDMDNLPEQYHPYFSYEENYDLSEESPLNVEECKEKVLSVLSLEEMTLWYLFFIERKSQKDISDILHISQTAVKSRVLRLKLKLNKRIDLILNDTKS